MSQVLIFYLNRTFPKMVDIQTTSIIQTIGRKIVFGKIIEAGILKSTSGKAIAAGNY